MDHQAIGKAVRDRRLLLGLNQGQVAELAGVGRRTISDLEGGNGPRGTTLTKVIEICHVLGLELTVQSAGIVNDER